VPATTPTSEILARWCPIEELGRYEQVICLIQGRKSGGSGGHGFRCLVGAGPGTRDLGFQRHTPTPTHLEEPDQSGLAAVLECQDARLQNSAALLPRRPPGCLCRASNDTQTSRHWHEPLLVRCMNGALGAGGKLHGLTVVRQQSCVGVASKARHMREHANLWGFVAGWVSLGLAGR